MQTSNNFLNDVAKVASGAVSAVTGLKGDAEGLLRRQVERLLVDMDLVSRDEFEAVKALAANARAEQEKLSVRVAELEAQLKPNKSAVAPKKTVKKA